MIKQIKGPFCINQQITFHFDLILPGYKLRYRNKQLVANLHLLTVAHSQSIKLQCKWSNFYQITNLRNRYKNRKKGFAVVSEYHFILDPKKKYFRKKQNS